MNQAEYLNLSRKRKRTTKQIDEEREKSLEKNTIYRGGLDEQTREWVRGTKRNKLGPSKLGPTKSSETIRDRIANKLDKNSDNSGRKIVGKYEDYRMVRNDGQKPSEPKRIRANSRVSMPHRGPTKKTY